MTAKGELTPYQRDIIHTAYMTGAIDFAPRSTINGLIKRGMIVSRGDDWVLTEKGKAAAKNIHEYRLRRIAGARKRGANR